MTLGDWARERWFDVRNGYGMYLGIALSFVNLILLLSVKFPGLFGETWLGTIVLSLGLGLGITGLSAAIGYAHRKVQMFADQDSAFKQARLASRVQLILLKTASGQATKEEIDSMTKLLNSIAEGDA